MIVRLPKYNYNKLYIYLISLYFGDYDYIVIFYFFKRKLACYNNFLSIVIEKCVKYEGVNNQGFYHTDRNCILKAILSIRNLVGRNL